MSKINNCDINYVQPEKIPLDLEYWHDIITGNGIRLTSVESFDKKNNKIYTGLQSEFFGTDFSSDWAFKERYTCRCGKYLGKAYMNMVCENCGTPVEYADIDLNKTGWVLLDTFYVLSPIYSAKIAEALGKVEGESVLRLILNRKYHEEGALDLSEKEQLLQKKHPYIQKGMVWLKDNLLEVLSFYEKRKPGKAALFKEIKDEIDMVWTHAIPIYTALLRTELPGEKGSKIFKLKINTHFKSIIKTANIINEYADSMVPDENGNDVYDYETLNAIDIYLKSMQKDIDAVFEITYKDLTDKTGVIVGKVLGGRYNFSARSIIVPNSGQLRSNEVILGYIPFVELFRYEIQNEYRKIYGCTPAQANTIWKKATNRYDSKIYAIIEHMCNNPETQKKLGLLINRNPSINYGSFIYVTVKSCKKDINDKTLTISTQIITPANADFDGDLLNCFRIIGDDFQRRFSKNLDPKYNLFVSRMDGKANPEVLPVKDEIVAFWAFNNM